ncbi:MAG: hypothetical protein BRD55_11570 [Bacteroidetes bacterium SW_9_63_38]|nr:MAG: hypothetical protein BRD55_11570 [Bacteroidetes bacterium SW_9_63_38]
MSSPDSDAAPSESLQTLFNSPPEEGGVDLPEEDTVGLRLSLPSDRAQRLKAVAKQLGLTPSIIAERAIEMVCEEVITIQGDQPPPRLHIEQYQARLDLLHAVQNADAPAPKIAGAQSPDDPNPDEG